MAAGRLAVIVTMTAFALMSLPCGAQQAQPELTAAEADGPDPVRKLVKWNEYEGKYVTARLGFGFLNDYMGYSQDDESKEQLTLRPDSVMRDFRFLLKGKFPTMPRLSYSIGYMYDKNAESWRWRQTGLMINVPELHGGFFIGRTKETFSTNKMMVGYHGWTIERASINDAFLPILADGIKWTGVFPSGKFVYKLGWFSDTRSEHESFNKNDNQFTGRAVWLPFGNEDGKDLLHISLSTRYGEADDGAFRFRAKPEAYAAQEYAIDTGTFPAHHSNMVGVDTYYRHGPLMIGMEYFFNQVSSAERDDPFLHGGEVFVAYVLTGETRPYYTNSTTFGAISPAKTVFSGGPGAFDIGLRFSYADLDDGPIQGGTFWRITPVFNWHLSDNVRFEVAYGYGELDRFGIKGKLQVFQTRLQLSL